VIKDSSSWENSRTASVSQNENDEVVKGNNWKVLKPASIGEGVYKDRVTVILPCYMGQEELTLTFASLSKQTYPHDLLEAIVVDDGSEPSIKLPSELPFKTSVVSQERDGFGLARARNLGVERASGEILIFLDCDMIPEPQLVEAHARWHHVNRFSLTLGFRHHADFSEISVEDLLRVEEIESLFTGKVVTSPQWIEFHMRRTKNLTSDDSDLFRIATGGNLGIRKSFFKDIGGFDGSFKQWGGEDIEFGFRAFNSGGILIPERSALAWHQGEGASPDQNEQVSLVQQRHRLSHLIAEKTFRQSLPGRSFEIPILTVLIDSTSQTFEEVSAQVNSVLASTFHDLKVVLKVPFTHHEKVNIERQYGLDPRVEISEDAINEIPHAAYRLELPPRVCITSESINFLIKSIEKFAVGEVTLEKFGKIRIGRNRALRRAEQLGALDIWETAKLYFGENAISEDSFAGHVVNQKNFARSVATANPPIWQLIKKVLKKFKSIRSSAEFRNFAYWSLRGFVNVFKRAKFSRKSWLLIGKKGFLSSQSDWLRIVGDASYFPSIKKWQGKEDGVEVVVFTPDAIEELQLEGTTSIRLGNSNEIPLAPPFNEILFNPSGYRPVKKDAAIENFPLLINSDERISKASSALALEIEKIDSPEKALSAVQYLALGIPMLVKDMSQMATWLGEETSEVLARVDVEKIKNPSEREKISVQLRRSVLSNHSLSSRLLQIRKVAGLTVYEKSPISIVVATKRPSMVDRIVEIVEMQDYLNLELVLALHGDSFPEGFELSKADNLPITVLQFPGKTIFGKVLSEATAAASGEWIAKMDDDDWYGIEHISDLHLAAKYSSADLVGKGSEFVFLQEKDLTIRRDLGNSEVESGTLAGGTLLIKSELMREVNGWRELNRGVDVALIKDAQLAGCKMWRTHPFGYLLRRTSGQHTWEADDKYFLRQSEQKWDGIATDLVGVIDN